MIRPNDLSILFWLLATLFWGTDASAIVQSTPAELLMETQRIQHEVEIIRDHLGTRKGDPVSPIHGVIKPRNIWQKGHEILFKINLLRQNHGLPRITAVTLAPAHHLDPALLYGMTQRILTELTIFKHHRHITSEASPTIRPQPNRSWTDLFNHLNWISHQIDLMIGHPPTPSAVFAQGMRVLADINAILSQLNKDEWIHPPDKKAQVQLDDLYETATELLIEIQRIQGLTHQIKRIDLSALPHHTGTRTDLFNLLGQMIAELQPIKAYLGLHTRITPHPFPYREKTAGDVQQLLTWIRFKLHRIRTLDR